MLNARIYRTAWLVAGVALIVALLTLQSPPAAPQPSLPTAFDGQSALELTGELAAVAPERAPGTPDADRAAEWVREHLADVPGVQGKVQEQAFSANADGRMVQMRNLYVVVPADGNGATRPAILVVAPRDTPKGVPSGASATGLLLALARQWATTTQDRPMLFVSTDGSTTGNAGMRWFLRRFSQVPIEAAVVLDDPGAGTGREISVWSWGRTSTGSLGLASIASQAIERAGGDANAFPGIVSQLARLAVPQTFGDQGPVIGKGIPAVTLAARPDSPPRAGPAPELARMELAGEAATSLIGSLDGASAAPPVAAQVEIGGRHLRQAVLRIVVLLLALPLLVAGIDAMARLRRARVPLRPGLVALLRRSLPFLAFAAVGYALVLVGILPGAAAGAPPLPSEVTFGALSGLALGIALAASAAVVLMGHRRAGLRTPGNPAAEAAAAAVALAGIAVVAWILVPFELLFALPLMHASLVATAATRRWQVVALGVVAALPVLLLALVAAGELDRNPVYAAWYLTATTLAGTRGVAGVVLWSLVLAAAWSLASLVVLRARKGLVAAGHHEMPGGRAARDARRRMRERRRRQAGPRRRPRP